MEEIYVKENKRILLFIEDKVEIKNFTLSSKFLSSYFRTEGVLFVRIIYYIILPVPFTVIFITDVIIFWISSLFPKAFAFVFKGIIYVIQKVFDSILDIIKYLFQRFFGKILKVLGLAIAIAILYVAYTEGYLKEFLNLIKNFIYGT